MRKARLGIFALSFLAAACDFRGCSGQSFTLVYSGPKAIQAKAAVFKGDEPIGYVESAKAEGAAQRLSIRVRDVAQVHERDAFIPNVVDNQTGLQVLHMGGASIAPGALLYYPPRAQPAPQAQAAAAKSTAKAPAPPAAPDSPIVDADDAAVVSGPVIGWQDDSPLRRSVRRSLNLVRESSNWPPDVQYQVNELMSITLKPGSDLAVLKEAHGKLLELQKSLQAAASSAYKQGDKSGARDAVNAAYQVALLESRMKDLKRRATEPKLAPEGAEN